MSWILGVSLIFWQPENGKLRWCRAHPLGGWATQNKKTFGKYPSKQSNELHKAVVYSNLYCLSKTFWTFWKSTNMPDEVGKILSMTLCIMICLFHHNGTTSETIIPLYWIIGRPVWHKQYVTMCSRDITLSSLSVIRNVLGLIWVIFFFFPRCLFLSIVNIFVDVKYVTKLIMLHCCAINTIPVTAGRNVFIYCLKRGLFLQRFSCYIFNNLMTY